MGDIVTLKVPSDVLKWSEPERETLLCMFLALATEENASVIPSKGFLDLCSSCEIDESQISRNPITGREFSLQPAFEEFLSAKNSEEAIFDEMIKDAAASWSQQDKQQSVTGLVELGLYGLIGCTAIFLLGKHKLRVPKMTIDLPGGGRIKTDGPAVWEYDGKQDIKSLAQLVGTLERIQHD